MVKRLGLVALLAAGCHHAHALPADLTGTYTAAGAAAKTTMQGGTLPAMPGMPQDLQLPDMDMSTSLGGPDVLTVTSTGISMKSGDMMHAPQIKVGPITAGGGANTSDLFDSVDCSSKTTCTFQTKGHCEGSIEKDAKGALKIIATGTCSDWAGTWTPRP